MKRLFIALVASSFLATPMAFAQPSQQPFEVAQMQDRHPERRVEKRIIKRVIINKRFSRGHRLSAVERRREARISDYRRYKLREPARGQRWVRVDNQFLLISTATGVIIGLGTN